MISCESELREFAVIVLIKFSLSALFLLSVFFLT